MATKLTTYFLLTTSAIGIAAINAQAEQRLNFTGNTGIELKSSSDSSEQENQFMTLAEAEGKGISVSQRICKESVSGRLMDLNHIVHGEELVSVQTNGVGDLNTTEVDQGKRIAIRSCYTMEHKR